MAKPAQSLGLRLAKGTFYICLLYWITSAFFVYAELEILVAASFQKASRDTISFMMNASLGVDAILTLVFMIPVYLLLFRYRANWFVAAQRMRFVRWGYYFMIPFFVLALPLVFSFGLSTANPTTYGWLYDVGSALGVVDMAFGIFFMTALIPDFFSAWRSGHYYGHTECIRILSHLADTPELARPKTLRPLIEEFSGIITSAIQRGIPYLSFQSVEDGLAVVILCATSGTDEEKAALGQFLERTSRQVQVSRWSPLEAGRELISSFQNLKTELPRIETLRSQNGVGWAQVERRKRFLDFLSPYTDVLVLVLTAILVIETYFLVR